MMRPLYLSMSILALLGATLGQAAEELPKRLDFSRYDSMLKRSPFAVASAVALPAATPNFAKDLYVANAGKLPEGGDFVTIASTSEKGFKAYLTTKGPVDGYSIASIEWSEKVGATKVTISKDGQFATLKFNEALLSQQPPPPAGAPAPPQPMDVNRVGRPGAAIPVPTPALPAPAPARTPRVRGTIQRYPTPPAQPPPRGRP
jgi:hypothetical protein